MSRPGRRNAFNTAHVNEMMNVFDSIETDDSVRAVIITGGDKCFSAGMDLKQPADIDAIRLFFKKVENCSRPVIAAINGACLAGGLELAICCDLRIASEDAIFGLPEIRFGALAIGGATQRLPRIVGMGKAKEMHYIGDPIDAQEAYRIGLVNKLMPNAAVMDEAKKIAKTLSERSRSAMRLVKFLVNTGMRVDLNTGMEYEAELSRASFEASREETLEARRKAAEREGTYKKIFG